MSLRWRLILLIVFATGVPVLTGVLVTRLLVREVLDVGLSPQLDAALEAGVRQAREGFRTERDHLQDDTSLVAAVWPTTSAMPEQQRRAAVAVAAESLLTGAERVILDAPDGRRVLLVPGRLPTETEARSPDAPPQVVSASADLGDGWSLRITRAVPAAWQDDARLLAETLQVVRGLRMQQNQLERMYWIPFLLIFLLALAVGLAAAMRLGRGITEPVRRLVAGTEAVSSGRWTVQVPVAHQDELGRLTTGFNTMVRTLELQSRRLVDLETMAGWREMARALAHEVKNPLTPIQLTVEEMRARYPGGDPQYEALLHECTRIVVEEVESLRSVVARFREFSKPVELEPVPTDLNRLVQDVAALQRDLAVDVTTADDLEFVPFDADRIRQVLMNLAVNAREATSQADQPRLAMTVDARPDWAAVIVEDNGPGIPPDERDRVFEPYRSGKAGGLGLGLALVKGIVLAHGGDIGVDEGRWGGARFTITLPREPVTRKESHHG